MRPLVNKVSIIGGLSVFFISQPVSRNGINSHNNYTKYLIYPRGRGGALVESMPFDRRVKSHSSHHIGTLDLPSLTVACSALACKLQQCQLLWSGALLKVSCPEKCYRNG